jgi:tetratricopeptide (TPR) repeat protein
MPYFDSDKSLSTIGEELGANYIVEGSVRRIDNHVRIIVQLIEASSDHHLWANNFDRQLQDEFAAQSAAAKDIAGSIHRELVPNSGGSVSGLPTDNIKAYDLFTRAQNIAKTEAESEATFHRQRELLEQAVAEDPEFVEAWGMLNEVLDHSIRSSMMNGWFIDEGEDPNAVQDEMAAAAKHSLEQAVSLDPDNFWTLLARHHDPMEEYRAEFNAQSIELVNRIVREYPEQPLGWLALGWSYHYGGDMELADTAFRKAIELDPFHAGIVYSCLHHFRSAGNQDMVDMLYDRLAQIAPEDGDLTRLSDAGVDTRLWNLLQAYFQSPDDRLIDRHGEILFDPDSRFISSYSQLRHEADYWAIRDDPDRILALVDRFEWSGSSSFMDVAHFNFVSIVAATIYFERGEMENARSLARQILATASAPQANFPGTVVGNFNAYARACGVLGDDDCARDWAENAMEKGRDQDFWSRFSGYMALSAVDVDRAVQLILEDKTADPRYLGTDVIATFQIFNRHVLRHPDMIDFYRQEGKWIDYLSQRMPEYAQD